MSEQTKQQEVLEHILCAKGLIERDLSKDIELVNEYENCKFGIIIKVCGKPLDNGICPYIRRGFTINGTSYYPCNRDNGNRIPKNKKRLE